MAFSVELRSREEMVKALASSLLECCILRPPRRRRLPRAPSWLLWRPGEVEEEEGEEGGAGPPCECTVFPSSFTWRALLPSFSFFFGERGEQEARQPHFDGRTAHGSAGDCRTGTVENQLPP